MLGQEWEACPSRREGRNKNHLAFIFPFSFCTPFLPLPFPSLSFPGFFLSLFSVSPSDLVSFFLFSFYKAFLNFLFLLLLLRFSTARWRKKDKGEGVPIFSLSNLFPRWAKKQRRRIGKREKGKGKGREERKWQTAKKRRTREWGRGKGVFQGWARGGREGRRFLLMNAASHISCGKQPIAIARGDDLSEERQAHVPLFGVLVERSCSSGP